MELLIHLGKSAAILTIFYLVYWIVLRKDNIFTANRHYLLAGIASAIFFPFVEFTKTIYVDAPAIILSSVGETYANAQLISGEEIFSINWWQIVAIIYFTGVTVMLFRFLKQLYSLLTLLKRCPTEKKDGYTYLKIIENSAPFSFFNYIVYNPSLHSQDELAMILKHEQVHVTQRHSIDIIASNLMLIFQWGNPIAWLYKKSIEENLEFIADSATVQEVKSLKQYQLALVRASSSHPMPALTSNFYQSFIKKRILMLNKSTSKKINVWKLSIILPFLALFLWSFNVKETIAYNEVSLSNYEEFGVASDFSKSENNLSISSETKNNSILTEELIPEKIIERENNKTSENNSSLSRNNVTINDINVTITKDTSLEELKAIKKDLESQGITFDFKNVVYNDKKEITAISLSYKDTNNNSGNYSVNSDKSINTIRIFGNDESISVNSYGSGSHAYSRGKNAHMQSMLRERNEKMHQRNEEMHKRHIEMNAGRMGVNDELKENIIAMHEAQNELREENKKILREQMQNNPEHKGIIHKKRMNRDYNRVSNHFGNEKSTTIIMPSSGESRELIVIDKNTSNEALDKIKNGLADQNITFKYKKITRNDKGEITGIKIDVENDKSSKTSTMVDGEGKAIDEIIIKI